MQVLFSRRQLWDVYRCRPCFFSIILIGRVLEVEQKEILERMREQHQAAAEQAKKRASTS
jgi:hypothetical protein